MSKGPLSTVASAVDSRLSNMFAAWAKIVARTPVPFIPACVLFALIMGVNNLRMYGTLEVRPSKMFCPPESPAIPQSEIMKDNFDVAKRFQTFIVTDGGGNMLTKSNLQRTMSVLDIVKSMRTDPVAPSYCPNQAGDCVEQQWDFSQLCLKQFGDQCAVISVLNLWQQDAAILDSQSQDEILNRINNPPPTFPPLDDMLGGISRNSDGKIVAATAVQTSLLLEYRADPELAEAGIMVAPWTDAPSEAWEELMVETLVEVDGVTVNTQGSQSLEYMGAAIKDIQKLGVGYILVFGYTALTFGAAFPCLPCNPNRGAVKSRAIMTLACVFTLNFSVVTTFGLCSWFGWFITPLNAALPFILLGVAVDDAFVIVTCFNEECGWHLDPADTEGRAAAMSRPVEERISNAMKHAGVSISITSVTNVVAFGIGYSSKLPALASFCVFASIGVLAIYCYMLTFFTACLSLDDRRQAASRRDCTPCFKNEAGTTLVPSRGTKLRTCFAGPYANFVMKTPVRVGVILISVVWVGVSLWMSTELGQAWDWMAFVPDDSYLKDFFEDRSAFPSALMYPVDVVWQVPAYPAVKKLAALETTLRTSDWVMDGTVESWYGEFCASGTAVCDDDASSETAFMSALNLWLESAGQAYTPDIKMNNDGSKILLSRMKATHEPSSVSTSEGMVDAMFGLREEVDNAAPGAFPFTYTYMFWEQFAVVKDELFRNCALALLCVLVICTVMIAHPGTALLVCLMVCATLFSMGGVDYILGNSIDAIGMVCFAFAVGISVDYSVHIGHNFMMQQGSNRVERVKSTFVEMGVPVFHGGVSTFLAVMMLSTAVSYSMRLFFVKFASVCIFGLWHALVLLPCILSFIGADPFDRQDTPAVTGPGTKPSAAQVTSEPTEVAKVSQVEP